jgi:xylulose-5-phosphate/fructose-6-phosphate phosphoketolase
MDAINRTQGLGEAGARARQRFNDRLAAHRKYIVEYGEDMPQIRDWRWPWSTAPGAGD